VYTHAVIQRSRGERGDLRQRDAPSTGKEGETRRYGQRERGRARDLEGGKRRRREEERGLCRSRVREREIVEEGFCGESEKEVEVPRRLSLRAHEPCQSSNAPEEDERVR